MTASQREQASARVSKRARKIAGEIARARRAKKECEIGVRKKLPSTTRQNNLKNKYRKWSTYNKNLPTLILTILAQSHSSYCPGKPHHLTL